MIAVIRRSSLTGFFRLLTKLYMKIVMGMHSVLTALSMVNQAVQVVHSAFIIDNAREK